MDAAVAERTVRSDVENRDPVPEGFREIERLLVRCDGDAIGELNIFGGDTGPVRLIEDKKRARLFGLAGPEREAGVADPSAPFAVDDHVVEKAFRDPLKVGGRAQASVAADPK